MLKHNILIFLFFVSLFIFCFDNRNINWTAPEILIDNGRDVSELSDVWSLAVVASEILTGEIPFDTQQYRQLTVESFVDALAMDLRPSLPTKIPEEIHKQV